MCNPQIKNNIFSWNEEGNSWMQFHAVRKSLEIQNKMLRELNHQNYIEIQFKVETREQNFMQMKIKERL